MGDNVLGRSVQVSHAAHNSVRVQSHHDQVYSVSFGEIENPFRGRPGLNKILRVTRDIYVLRGEFPQLLDQAI